MVVDTDSASEPLFSVLEMLRPKTIRSAQTDAQAHALQFRHAARNLLFRTEIPVELARSGAIAQLTRAGITSSLQLHKSEGAQDHAVLNGNTVDDTLDKQG